MSLVDYNLALNYAMKTYVRRDIGFVMRNIFGKKEGKDKKTFGYKIRHPGIENYVKESYEGESS